MKDCIRTTEPFAAGYLEAGRDNIEYRVAAGMFELAKYRPISLKAGDFYAGLGDCNSKYAVQYTYGNGILVNGGLLREKIERNPECADELEALADRMLPLDTRRLIHNGKSAHDHRIVAMKAGWGGGDWGGHSNPDYGMLLRDGTDVIRARIGKYREINAGNDDFYDALALALDALELLGVRIRERALTLAESCAEDARNQLLRIADTFTRIPKQPPRDFFEACQMFWYIFMFDGVDSPGRLDQAMIECYRRSEEADRRRCLDALWGKFRDTRTWNLCIGGSNADWEDETNVLTYAILETARKFRYNTPNLTMRVHPGTPEKLWREAASCIATGIGMPALYNDSCVVPALEALGISAEDAHNYCMNGCNQIDIFGKSHMGLEDGEVCLAKCLELALNNGVCAISGEMLGLETGDAAAFTSYGQLYEAYKAQVEFITDAAIRMANMSQQVYAENAPNPHRSNLIAGCIEKAKDYKNGGPLYGHGQILAEGIADAADSLAAVKHLVFDTGRYTMAELVAALRADFVGYEQLYRDFSAHTKFGNDDPETDAVYKEIMEHFYRYLLTKRTFRGGIYGGGCSTFQRSAEYGKRIGALPSGKRHGEPMLADSIGAVPGCDKNGPTALLSSVMSVDQTLAKSGNVLNIKFSKSLFGTDAMQAKFILLAKTYFAGKGQQLSVNVVSAEELRDAKLHPEQYANLIVRVGGYSEYFNRLPADLQDNIIARTEN